MKKVVVVVENEKIVFQGEHLEVIDSGFDTSASKVLVIKESKNNIAVFNHWNYWREIRENDKSVKNKVIIRPKKPVTINQIKDLVDGIKNNDLIVISHDFQVIVLDSFGEAKIL